MKRGYVAAATATAALGLMVGGSVGVEAATRGTEAAKPASVSVKCGDTKGLVRAVGTANRGGKAVTVVLNPERHKKCDYVLTSRYGFSSFYQAQLTVATRVALKGNGARLVAGKPTQRKGSVLTLVGVTPRGHLEMSDLSLVGSAKSPLDTQGLSVQGEPLTPPAKSAGAPAAPATVVLRDTSVTGFRTRAVTTDGNTRIELRGSSTVAKNTAGVQNTGTLEMYDTSAVRDNVGPYSGAGITNPGTLKMYDRSVVRHNTDLGPGPGGGGILNSGTATLADRAAVTGNTSTGVLLRSHSARDGDKAGATYVRLRGALGGGVHNTGTLTLRDNASVTGNTAKAVTERAEGHITGADTAQGGGLYTSGTLSVLGRAQVTGNTVVPGVHTDGSPIGGQGGGVYRDAGRLTLAPTAAVRGNKPGDCAAASGATACG